MPPREWGFRIKDILESIEKICRYTEGMTFEAFSSDDKTVDAVIRNLEIIGEAAKHIPEEIQKKHPDLPWPEMRGIRNVLIHEYFGVSLPILWETTQKNLPPLVPVLKKVLQNENLNLGQTLPDTDQI